MDGGRGSPARKFAFATTGYLAGCLVTASAALAGHRLFDRTQLADLVMLFLLGVLLVSMRWGVGPALFTAVISVLTFDFVFIPPYGTLAVADVRHLVTFLVMLLSAAVISGLTKRVRDQAQAAEEREARTASLYALSRALATGKTRDDVLAIGERHVATLCDAEPNPEQRVHLEAFERQIATALERVELAAQARAAELRVEAEQLKNSLLSSVSHDLRTPLAVITGMATTLTDTRLDPAVRSDLAETIVLEAERLNRLVRNLLDMTRVEGGALEVDKEWQPVEEVVGAALASTERVLGERPVTTALEPGLVAPFDAVLIQQVLVNLLENAAKHTDPAASVAVSARSIRGAIEIEVADRGRGVPPGDEERIFDKFYRSGEGVGGVGLGLAICKAIASAHGGKIWAENNADGGACFHFTLPLEGEPPALVADPPEPGVHQGSGP